MKRIEETIKKLKNLQEICCISIERVLVEQIMKRPPDSLATWNPIWVFGFTSLANRRAQKSIRSNWGFCERRWWISLLESPNALLRSLPLFHWQFAWDSSFKPSHLSFFFFLFCPLKPFSSTSIRCGRSGFDVWNSDLSWWSRNCHFIKP